MKYAVFALAAMGIPPLTLLLCLNPWWTRHAFWGMVVSMLFYQGTSINFFSHEEYRGSARGMEVSLIYLLDAAILASLVIRDKVRKVLPDIGAKLYLAYFLLCMPSLTAADDLLISWLEVWKMILIYFHFLAVYSYLRATDDMESVLKALAVFVIGNCIWVIRGHYCGQYQPGGVFPHRNCMAMAMLLLGPTFFAAYLTYGLKKWIGRLGAVAFVLAAVSTLWSYSRGAIVMMPLAYGITTFACFLKQSGRTQKFVRLLPFLVIAAIGVAVIMPRIIQRFESAPKSSGDTRVELAACAREMIRDNPFTGVGINNWGINMDSDHPYQERASDALDKKLTHTGIVETVYLLVGAECGVPALVAMVVWFLWYLVLGVRILFRLKNSEWFFVPAGLIGGLTANYLQSVLEWVLRQQLNLVCLMFVFAMLSYLWSTMSHKKNMASITIKQG